MRVLFFAGTREVAGCEEIRLDWPGDAVGREEFWDVLIQRFPALGPFRSSVRLARNAEYWEVGTSLCPGDEVALIPPVSGG